MIPREDWFPPFPADLRDVFAARGLSLIGVADPRPDADRETEYRQWLAEGRAGSMGYLARHAHQKYNPAQILPAVRSILFVGIGYFQEDAGIGSGGEPRGRIARYAWGRDYHRVLGGKLRAVCDELRHRWPQDRFLPGSDSTALAESYYAERAGIGFAGRNGLLISSQYGSWFLVGEILTTRTIATDGQTDIDPAAGRHGACPRGCRRCLDVCPTGALLGDGRIDATRCVSYLTIEHLGSIPQELRSLMGDWLFGCDLCQEVCPLNVRRSLTDVGDFRVHRAGSTRELRQILSIADHADMVRLFAGSPVMRARRSGLVRNACVVAANLGGRSLLPQLRLLSQDHDPVVREHARWAVICLDPQS